QQEIFTKDVIKDLKQEKIAKFMDYHHNGLDDNENALYSYTILSNNPLIGDHYNDDPYDCGGCCTIF
ncbi:hypothetical protein OAP56_00800, partial [Rickettsiaceae bacterium]|nr:hypothetical protein [Rickettsiaceae bacterium]